MDVFGQALRAYADGDQTSEIRIERDDGWIDAHSPGLYFAPEPFAFERPALEMARGPVLDIGCGAGRHLLWCAGQGIEAVGIDASPGAVAVCVGRGARASLCDIMAARPDLPIAPATLTLFGNNIGIGGDFDGAVRLLRRLRALVAPGRRLLFTGLDPGRTARPEHLAYHARNAAAGRRKGELRIRCHYRDATSDWFDWYHPEPDEVADLAGRGGWVLERLDQLDGFFWACLRAPT